MNDFNQLDISDFMCNPFSKIGSRMDAYYFWK